MDLDKGRNFSRHQDAWSSGDGNNVIMGPILQSLIQCSYLHLLNIKGASYVYIAEYYFSLGKNKKKPGIQPLLKLTQLVKPFS